MKYFIAGCPGSVYFDGHNMAEVVIESDINPHTTALTTFVVYKHNLDGRDLHQCSLIKPSGSMVVVDFRSRFFLFETDSTVLCT